jgi:hypothetical protein
MRAQALGASHPLTLETEKILVSMKK